MVAVTAKRPLLTTRVMMVAIVFSTQLLLAVVAPQATVMLALVTQAGLQTALAVVLVVAGPTGGAGHGTGNAGGIGAGVASYAAGSGGGAGAPGTNAGSGSSVGSTDGGIGVTTTIITAAQATANSVGEVDSGNVYFGGGGASSPYTYHSNTPASGGLGGGGDSVVGTYASYGAINSGHGTPNTGGGGAGYTNSTYGAAGAGAGGVVTGTINDFPTGQAKSIVVGAGGAPHPTDNTGGGGSGVIILKYPSRYTPTFTAGVTQTTITDGSNKISFITATTNTSQTVTFS